MLSRSLKTSSSGSAKGCIHTAKCTYLRQWSMDPQPSNADWPMSPLQMAFLSRADWLHACFRALSLEVLRKRMSSTAILSRSQMQDKCTLNTPCTPHSLFFTWEDPLQDILVLPQFRYPDLFTLEGRMCLKGDAAPGIVLQYAPCAVRVHQPRTPLPAAQARQCGCNW